MRLPALLVLLSALACSPPTAPESPARAQLSWHLPGEVVQAEAYAFKQWGRWEYELRWNGGTPPYRMYQNYYLLYEINFERPVGGYTYSYSSGVYDDITGEYLSGSWPGYTYHVCDANYHCSLTLSPTITTAKKLGH